MADAPASNAVIDFTNVKEVDIWNKKRQPEGDYTARITKVADSPSKKDDVAQWVFTIVVGNGNYPYYIKHTENQYWKLRNLLIACGMNVPKKRVQVNPNKLVGRTIGVTLEDGEYDGKAQSNISTTLPVSELEDRDVPDEDDDDEDEDPLPKVKTTKVKTKPAPIEEDDDDEDEEEEPAPPPRKKKKVVVVEEEDEDEDEDEQPAPPPKKKKKPAPVVEDDDEDLEEIDIDDT